jgi:hypothetical protein
MLTEFSREDASQTHKTKRANTYVRKKPKTKRDPMNPGVKG